MYLTFFCVMVLSLIGLPLRAQVESRPEPLPASAELTERFVTAAWARSSSLGWKQPAGSSSIEPSLSQWLTKRTRQTSWQGWVYERNTVEKGLLGVAAGIGLSFLVVEALDVVIPCTPNEIKTCDLPKLKMAAQGLAVTVPLGLVGTFAVRSR